MTLLESTDIAPQPIISPRHPASGWTEPRIDYLKRRWSEGASASQIARELGGVTRSAVLGKKDRLGLEDRVSGWGAGAPVKHGERRGEIRRPNRRPDSFHRSPIGRPTAPSLPVDLNAPSPYACTLVELDDTKCHFPIGDPAEDGFHFCGGTAEHERGPYCTMHYRVAYRRA